MLAPVRVTARTRFTFRYFVSTVLFTTLVAAACADDGPSVGGGTSGSAGHAGNGGTGAGGLGGERDQGGSLASAGVPDAGSGSGSDTGGQNVGGQSGQSGEGGQPELPSGGEGGADSSAGGAGGEPPVSEAAALPCSIKNLLGTRCQGCHGNPPVPGAGVSLLTHADLTAPSQSDATLTVAARSLKRMKDALAPMPPSPATHATAEEIATLETWIDAGAPRGECNYDPNDPNSNPYDAPAKCSSGHYWTANDTGSTWMMPGRACVTCHRMIGNSFAPQFSVAGTVFPTAHEPDKCYGVPLATGAKIIITDATGQELPPIEVVSGGNFGVIFPNFARPYRAKVVVGNTERVMLTPQTNGDCNACHSQNGAQGALGRIILP